MKVTEPDLANIIEDRYLTVGAVKSCWLISNRSVDGGCSAYRES